MKRIRIQDMARFRICATRRSNDVAKKIRLQLSHFAVNAKYTDSSFIEQFRSELKEKEPFPHWQLCDFLHVEPAVLKRLNDELIKYKGWNRKENDLYSLYQTPDLKTVDGVEYPTIRAFREFLCNEMRAWLSYTSGIELLPKVDSTGSCYQNTDCLLPHSDQVENRRFAFVFYFTEEWLESYGGQTNIYNCDENCDPTTVFASLTHPRNSLLLFEVSEKSWHSVTEVVGEDHDPRLSINGWFHTTRPIQPRVRPPLIRPRHTPKEEVDLTAVLTDKLFGDNLKEDLKKAFNEDGQMLINLAFQESFSNKILDELDSATWIEKGPVNKRWIAEFDVDGDSCQGAIADFVKALRSQTMMNFVEKMTGFEFQDPQNTIWAYRLTRGCYTVLGDEDAEQFVKDGPSVDYWFYFGKSQWEEDAGGVTVYIRKDQETPVLLCPPTVNAMAVVYREKDEFPFVKYVNQLADEHPIYVFGLSVYGGTKPAKDDNEDGSGDAEVQQNGA
ncbi:hypothetical protein V3C99_016807 [Haemonchus contortus]